MRSVTNPPGQQLGSSCARFCLPVPWKTLRPAATIVPQPRVLHAIGEIASACGPSDLARLEAVLLIAREPLGSRKLSQFANLADGTQARTLVRRLNAGYEAAGRAYRIEHVAGGYQLRTRREFAPWLRRLAHVPGETRLSAPTLETLAVIAYRQPVPRADIEAIRGVNCGELLRQLIERDLVRISGRSAELGRPFLYSTTKRFLELFGFVDVDDLPHAETLRRAPLPAPGASLLALVPSGGDDSPSPALADEPLGDDNDLDQIDDLPDSDDE
jgi:segregation and condensation protein B